LEVQQSGGQRSHALATSRQLASKTNDDEPEIGVVTAAIRTKDAFVALRDDRESAVLVRGNGTLQLLGAPWFDDEPSRGDVPSVDRHVGNAAERTEIADAKSVHLPRPREDMPRVGLPNAGPFASRDYFDCEISVAHVRAP
jgi:hypothetical protein